MGLTEFIDDVQGAARTLTVYNVDGEEETYEELVEFLDVDNVTVRAVTVADAPANFAVLHQDGEAVAASTLADIRRGVFLADWERSAGGERLVTNGTMPDVIAGLDETTFVVDGRGKRILAQISRYIEELAVRGGDGGIHAGFQRLSRVREDVTHRTYANLAATDLGVHVYGLPDARLSEMVGVTVHASDADEIGGAWFVAYDGAGDDTRTAALVAEECGAGEYRGFWTFRGDLTDEVVGYVTDRYPPAHP